MRELPIPSSAPRRSATIYLFAGLIGDPSQNHVDDEFMSHSIYGKRIAHGALMVGFMSTASTRTTEESLRQGIDSTPVLLDYDGIRFLKPVYINDTVTAIWLPSASITSNGESATQRTPVCVLTRFLHAHRSPLRLKTPWKASPPVSPCLL